MTKERNRPIGSHVKWTKRDERPYVTASDLLKSESFRRAMKNPTAERKPPTQPATSGENNT